MTGAPGHCMLAAQGCRCLEAQHLEASKAPQTQSLQIHHLQNLYYHHHHHKYYHPHWCHHCIYHDPCLYHDLHHWIITITTIIIITVVIIVTVITTNTSITIITILPTILLFNKFLLRHFHSFIHWTPMQSLRPSLNITFQTSHRPNEGLSHFWGTTVKVLCTCLGYNMMTQLCNLLSLLSAPSTQSGNYRRTQNKYQFNSNAYVSFQVHSLASTFLVCWDKTLFWGYLIFLISFIYIFCFQTGSK